MPLSIMRRSLIGVVFAVATLVAAPAAFAQTYILHTSFTGPGGETGTATLEMANSTLVNANLGVMGGVAPELVSATLTFNNLNGGPASTTFNRSHLNQFLFARTDGTITDINFWSNPNADGYSLSGFTSFQTEILRGPVRTAIVTNTPAAPAAVPTMTEWAMIGFALALAGGAALMIQRRRTLSA